LSDAPPRNLIVPTQLVWRGDDPILASTTNAYLPKMPHEVQEGWIRVGPDTAPGSGP